MTCVKQVVTATIISCDGQRFVGRNDCENPQTVCPRSGMPTGAGYQLCKSICRQNSHAEIAALAIAGDKARGGTLYLEGHTYACGQCLDAASRAGCAVVVGSPPL